MQFSELNKLKRFREIVAILIKYGFDEIVQRMELPGADFIRRISPVEENMELYERIRCAIEELGPTFVKFGQIMSLRPDMLPSELLAELEKLQEDVPAFELADIEKMIEESLGKPIKDVFSLFSRHKRPGYQNAFKGRGLRIRFEHGKKRIHNSISVPSPADGNYH